MNDANPDIITNDILTLADRIFRALLPTVPDEILTLDITMPQMKILLLLYIHGPIRMSTLAAELRVTLPTATSLVDKLVEKNYVQRETQSDDRRVVLCKLAEAGNRAISGIWMSTRLRCQQLLVALDQDKLEGLKSALEAMLQSSDAQKIMLAGQISYEQMVKST